MGAVYTRTSKGQLLRSQFDRDAILQRFYHPHHASLKNAVDRELAKHGSSLIIDCHSFSSVPLPHEPDQRPHRPDICIGTDSFHTPASLMEQLMEIFETHGLQVAMNTPFSGSIVPLAHYRRTPNVHSLMIECNRSLYMDETTGERSAGFNDLKRTLDEVLVALS